MAIQNDQEDARNSGKANVGEDGTARPVAKPPPLVASGGDAARVAAPDDTYGGFVSFLDAMAANRAGSGCRKSPDIRHGRGSRMGKSRKGNKGSKGGQHQVANTDRAGGEGNKGRENGEAEARKKGGVTATIPSQSAESLGMLGHGDEGTGVEADAEHGGRPAEITQGDVSDASDTDWDGVAREYQILAGGGGGAPGDPPAAAAGEAPPPPAPRVRLTRLAPDGPLIPVADRPDVDTVPPPAEDAAREGSDGHSRKSVRIPRKSDIYHSSVAFGTAPTWPSDSYSFVAIHGPLAAPKFFFFGLGVWFCQMMFLVLMLISMVHPSFRLGQKDNPSDSFWGEFIPSNVSVLTHVTQVTALVTYCIFSDSSLQDCVKAVELFPRRDRTRGDDNYYGAVFACALRMSQGLLATLVTWLLIVTTADVVEIILNFAAVNYISGLDEVSRYQHKSGYRRLLCPSKTLTAPI